MAQTGLIGTDFDANAAYSQSFGYMQNKTAYYNPHSAVSAKSISGLLNKEGIEKSDLRGQLLKAAQIGMKAQTTQAGGAGTAGFAMIPIYVDPTIIDETRKFTPLVELVPRVSNQGMYADYNNIVAKGGGFTAAEGAALNIRDTTYNRNSTQIKFLYATGGVTGPTQAAQPSYILQGFEPQAGFQGGFGNLSAGNAMQQKVLEKTREIKELEENLIINGNATTSGIVGNPNGTEFDGIITLMGATNTVDKNTTAIDLKDLRKAIRFAYDDGGRPSLAVCSTGVYEDIENLLDAKAGFLKYEKDVFWGFSTIVLRGMSGLNIPVIPSMFMSNASGSKSIYFLDMSVVEMRVLQDLTYQELAITRDAKEFFLKIYEALIIRNVNFCASVTEIA